MTGENKKGLDVGSMYVSFSYRNLFKEKIFNNIDLDIAIEPDVDVVIDESYGYKRD